MYCHSLTTMMAILEEELKKVSFMECAARTTHLHSKGFTYTDIHNLAVTWYQESKGVGKWPPTTHAKDSKALPSSFAHAKVHALVQCFEQGQSTSCLQDKSNNTCNLCGKKGHWVNKCPNKACFTTKAHSNTTKPNGCSSGPSQHPGHRNSRGNHGYHQEG